MSALHSHSPRLQSCSLTLVYLLPHYTVILSLGLKHILFRYRVHRNDWVWPKVGHYPLQILGLQGGLHLNTTLQRRRALILPDHSMSIFNISVSICSMNDHYNIILFVVKIYIPEALIF